MRLPPGRAARVKIAVVDVRQTVVSEGKGVRRGFAFVFGATAREEPAKPWDSEELWRDGSLPYLALQEAASSSLEGTIFFSGRGAPGRGRRGRCHGERGVREGRPLAVARPGLGGAPRHRRAGRGVALQVVRAPRGERERAGAGRGSSRSILARVLPCSGAPRLARQATRSSRSIFWTALASASSGGQRSREVRVACWPRRDGHGPALCRAGGPIAPSRNRPRGAGGVAGRGAPTPQQDTSPARLGVHTLCPANPVETCTAGWSTPTTVSSSGTAHSGAKRAPEESAAISLTGGCAGRAACRSLPLSEGRASGPMRWRRTERTESNLRRDGKHLLLALVQALAGEVWASRQDGEGGADRGGPAPEHRRGDLTFAAGTEQNRSRITRHARRLRADHGQRHPLPHRHGGGPTEPRLRSDVPPRCVGFGGTGRPRPVSPVVSFRSDGEKKCLPHRRKGTWVGVDQVNTTADGVLLRDAQPSC